MPRKRSQTAAEFLADPAYQAKVEAQAREHEVRLAEFRRVTAPLAEELTASGLPAGALETYCADVPELPPQAVAALVSHLNHPQPPAAFEAIVRSLSRSDARAARPALERVFVAEDEPNRRWLVANAIAAMAKLKEVSHLPGMSEYAKLFHRTPPKPPHRPPAA